MEKRFALATLEASSFFEGFETDPDDAFVDGEMAWPPPYFELFSLLPSLIFVPRRGPHRYRSPPALHYPI